MASLGQRIREERLRQGREIRPISEELRIGSRYLEAIEAEQWNQLPGGFFNRSFVRQYAQALGLNGQQFENEYATILKRDPAVDMEVIGSARDPRGRLMEEKKLISIAPVTERSSSFFDGRTGLAVAALVVVIAGGGLVSLLWDKLRGSDAEAAPVAAVERPVLKPVVPAQPQPTTETAPVEPSITPVADDKPSTEGVMSLNIAATEKTWIEVTADGKRIFMGVLEPGQTQSMSTSETARMVVGNAGGITVQKAGRDIGPIGPRGQVRVVRLTKDQVEIMEPNRATPPKPAGEV